MIKVTDRFYINASNTCYTLTEKTTVKDETSKNYGNEIFKDLGYYTTLESCLKGILKVVTREFISKDEMNTIQDLLGEIKKQDEFLHSLKLNV
jgi:hypothetical protein